MQRLQMQTIRALIRRADAFEMLRVATALVFLGLLLGLGGSFGYLGLVAGLDDYVIFKTLRPMALVMGVISLMTSILVGIGILIFYCVLVPPEGLDTARHD